MSSSVSTGAYGLDAILGGGLKPGLVYEVVGGPGAGKTQLCHQLAVMVQLPPERGGLGARALYIDTEGTFRPERIVAMARYRGLDPEKALDGIIYARAISWEDVVAYALHAAEEGYGLIAVDSVTSPFSLAPGVIGLKLRRSRLALLLSLLLRAAERGSVVVITNRPVRSGVYGGLVTSCYAHVRLVLSREEGGITASIAYGAPPASAHLRLSVEGVLDDG